MGWTPVISTFGGISIHVTETMAVIKPLSLSVWPDNDCYAFVMAVFSVCFFF